MSSPELFDTPGEPFALVEYGLKAPVEVADDRADGPPVFPQQPDRRRKFSTLQGAFDGYGVLPCHAGKPLLEDDGAFSEAPEFGDHAGQALNQVIPPTLGTCLRFEFRL
jgi:hypothetical protein